MAVTKGGSGKVLRLSFGGAGGGKESGQLRQQNDGRKGTTAEGDRTIGYGGKRQREPFQSVLYRRHGKEAGREERETQQR